MSVRGMRLNDEAGMGLKPGAGTSHLPRSEVHPQRFGAGVETSSPRRSEAHPDDEAGDVTRKKLAAAPA